MIQYIEGQDNEELFHQRDLIQLVPYGVSLSTEDQRPLMLLRSLDQKHTLPVPLHPLEAGMTLTQSQPNLVPVSPHKLLQLLLQTLSIAPLQCVFVQIKGAHQFVRIYFQGMPETNSLKLRADEAMSLCLHLQIPIFATSSYIARSQQLKIDMESMTEVQRQTQLNKSRNHLYIQ